MLENTTVEKRTPINEASALATGDETTVEQLNNVEGTKDIVAEDRQTASSTITTVLSDSKQTGSSSNVYTASDICEEETDPTSTSSEMLDEPDRKCTESPVDSDEAVYGSDSVHSASSASSTEHTDLRRNVAAAVDLNKVEAMGGQFEENAPSREAASFHHPVNDTEARYITDRVIKANTTIEDISRHPEDHYKSHGSSFQVSARPKQPSESACDVGSDKAHEGKVDLASRPSTHLDIEEGIIIDRPDVRKRDCCCIM